MTPMEQALTLKEYCTDCRRWLHQNPELSFKEIETTAFIKKELTKLGLELVSTGETGVVGILRGDNADGPITALRADIDALPMADKSGKQWQSKNENAAHTCGHDGHTAIMLGVAKALAARKDAFKGTIKLLFQPAEEALGGAQAVVNAGALDHGGKPDTILCFHAWPYLNAGEIGAWPGQYMASADSFSITVKGQGGHGARPYKAVNPVVAGAHMVAAIQNIVASEIETAQQAVITVCTMNGGTAVNIIPDTATLGGTVRCLDPSVRKELETRIKRVANGVAAAFGCTVEVAYKPGVPSLINNPSVVADVLSSAKKALGNDSIKPLDGPVMGSEDFSVLAAYVGKGALIRLGVAAEGIECPALHNGAFDFSDDALPTGVAVMVQYILDRHN